MLRACRLRLACWRNRLRLIQMESTSHISKRLSFSTTILGSWPKPDYLPLPDSHRATAGRRLYNPAEYNCFCDRAPSDRSVPSNHPVLAISGEEVNALEYNVDEKSVPHFVLPEGYSQARTITMTIPLQLTGRTLLEVLPEALTKGCSIGPPNRRKSSLPISHPQSNARLLSTDPARKLSSRTETLKSGCLTQATGEDYSHVDAESGQQTSSSSKPSKNAETTIPRLYTGPDHLPMELRIIHHQARTNAILQQVRCGLAVVTDGQQLHENYIYHFCRRMRGVDFSNLSLRVYHNGARRTYVPSVAFGVAGDEKVGWLAEEWNEAQAQTSAPVKACLPGPFSIAGALANTHGRESGLVQSVVDVVKREVTLLMLKGCKHVQIDEPLAMLAASSASVAHKVETIGSCFESCASLLSVKTYVHLCRGQPAHLSQNNFPRVGTEAYQKVAKCFDQCTKIVSVCLEDDIGDPLDLSILASFKRAAVVLALVSSSTSDVEAVDFLRNRIRQALLHIGPDRLTLAADCSMGRLPEALVVSKLVNLKQAASSVSAVSCESRGRRWAPRRTRRGGRRRTGLLRRVGGKWSAFDQRTTARACKEQMEYRAEGRRATAAGAAATASCSALDGQPRSMSRRGPLPPPRADSGNSLRTASNLYSPPALDGLAYGSRSSSSAALEGDASLESCDSGGAAAAAARLRPSEDAVRSDSRVYLSASSALLPTLARRSRSHNLPGPSNEWSDFDEL